MIERPNLTHEEYLRLHGSLTEARCLDLIDTASLVESFEGVEAHISEASSCFPEEDFLSAVLVSLNNLGKHVRGENKAAVLEIVAALELVEQEVRQSAEYGADELSKAKKQIEGSK